MQDVEYEKMARAEGALWYYRALHRHVLRSLARNVPGAARVLDAGCGTGGLLRSLLAAQPAWQGTGLDASPLACEFARQRTTAEIVQGSVEALPFGDATFDAIASCDVLCQVAAPERALQEFQRCLKPGGVLVLTLPAYQWMYSYHDRQVGNLRRYARREADGQVLASGFREPVSTYWNMLPFPLAVLRRKLLPPARAGSDVADWPRPANAFFGALMALEHAWLDRGGRLPFGSSLLTVTRK